MYNKICQTCVLLCLGSGLDCASRPRLYYMTLQLDLDLRLVFESRPDGCIELLLHYLTDLESGLGMGN